MVKFKNNVLEFEPNKITDPSLWKYSDEYSVMATLMYFYPEKYWDLNHSDKPDLQYEDQIGIEVTQCLEDSYNKSIGEWTNYRLGKEGKSYSRCEKVISEQGGQLFEYGITHRVSDENTQMQPIRDRMDKKFLKLKDYRNKFLECSLAIILEEPVPSIPAKAIDYFCTKQKEYDYQFDNLIIITNRELIIFDYKSHLISKKVYTKEEARCFNYIGVMVVNELVSEPKDCMTRDF
mgnify:CR=1 FL=1